MTEHEVTPSYWVRVTGYRGETEGQRRHVDARGLDFIEIDRLSNCTRVELIMHNGSARSFHFDEFDKAIAFAEQLKAAS
jgi:hypothetical protein